MSDLYNRIASEHTSLQQLMMRLPGFPGYQQATDRRAADRLMRDHIVHGLKEQLTAFVQAEKNILNSPNGLASMSRLRDVQGKMQMFIDRINAAPPGYAGFYNSVKIGPMELQKLYDFDATLLGYVDQFKMKIDALHTAVTTKEGLDAAIDGLDTLTTEANSAYGQRDNVITGLTK